MKHYRPGHEPEEWPAWHDAVIVGLCLGALGLIWLLAKVAQ